MHAAVRTGLAFLVSILLLSSGAEAQKQTAPRAVTYTINGKVLVEKECHLLNDLQGAFGLKTAARIDRLIITHVRGFRPIKVIHLSSADDLKGFDLKAWANSTGNRETEDLSNPNVLLALGGDRIVIEAFFKNGNGDAASFCLK